MEVLEVTLPDFELEWGKAIPSFNHGLVQASLAAELRNRLRKTHIVTSGTNLKLGGYKMVPDLMIFDNLILDMQRDIQWVQEAPLAIIEILSFKQDLNQLMEKARLFLAAGVKSCWIVLPAVGTIAIFTGPTTYRTFANGSAVADEVLGVEIPLADIFS